MWGYLALVGTLTAVCVFCGSSTPPDRRYRETAEQLGETLARRGITLVYGGGSVGLMGVIADAALKAGGRVVGVIPRGLFGREIAHRGVTELLEVDSMHERKRIMYDLADGFIALPGGLGTLEELAEAATWSQLGIHKKPLLLLDVDGFWGPLISMLDRMVTVGLLKSGNRSLVKRAASVDLALTMLETTEPVSVERWISDEMR